MKNLIPLILICLLSSAFGQTLEFSGGISHNSLYDTQQIPAPVSSIPTYEGGLGHAARIGMKWELSKVNTSVPLFLKFSLGYSTYKARYIVAILTAPSTLFRTADVQKTTLDIGFYPLNMVLIKRLEISIGGELNIKVKGDFQDKRYLLSSFRCASGSFCTDFGNVSHRDLTFRLNSQFSYVIPLSPNLAIVPQYQFSMGLFEEFYGNRVNTKTLHNTFWIGIRKDL